MSENYSYQDSFGSPINFACANPGIPDFNELVLYLYPWLQSLEARSVVGVTPSSAPSPKVSFPENYDGIIYRFLRFVENI